MRICVKQEAESGVGQGRVKSDAGRACFAGLECLEIPFLGTALLIKARDTEKRALSSSGNVKRHVLACSSAQPLLAITVEQYHE